MKLIKIDTAECIDMIVGMFISLAILVLFFVLIGVYSGFLG